LSVVAVWKQFYGYGNRFYRVLFQSDYFKKVPESIELFLRYKMAKLDRLTVLVVAKQPLPIFFAEKGIYFTLPTKRLET
jgi:hypothetical protein